MLDEIRINESTAKVDLTSVASFQRRYLCQVLTISQQGIPHKNPTMTNAICQSAVSMCHP